MYVRRIFLKLIPKIVANATENSYICVLIFIKILYKMSKNEKLIERFKTLPSDFTFEEMQKLFSIFGFVENSKGRTSGSRTEFENKEKELSYTLHKPHPVNAIKKYVMKQVLEYLQDNDLLDR